MSTLLLFIGGSGSNWNCDLLNWLTFPFPFWLLARLKSLGIPGVDLKSLSIPGVDLKCLGVQVLGLIA